MANVNRLRQLLDSGQITQEDLTGITLSGRLGGEAPAMPDPQGNQLRQMLAEATAANQPQGFVRNEETGSTTYLPRPAAQIPRYRVVGANGRQTVDLGEEQGALPPVDPTRGGIEIAGLGKGQYSRDGRYAIVNGPDGSKTKVILGYDAEGSRRATAQTLAAERQRAELDQTREQVGLLRDKRAMLAAANAPVSDAAPGPLTQKQLEEVHGKPDKGFRWSQSGTLEPLPGGEVQRDAGTAVDKANDAVSQVDALIGKRGPDGKPVDGAKPHPGFGQAVGLGIPGLKYIPGSSVADFNRRLDQLKGGAFLQAFESLKGGGQITEVEGRKATDAITRMSTSQSEDEFVAAAAEFRNIVERGAQKAQGRAGGAQPRPMPQDTAPPAGGRRFGSLPSATAFRGKVAIGDDGTRYVSDGTQWVRQ